MSERDTFIEQMELEKGCGRPGGLSHSGSHDYSKLWLPRPTHGENFDFDTTGEALTQWNEWEPLTTAERLMEDALFEQAIKSVAASYYHTNLVSLISERIGEGEPLDVLLRDTYMREKLNLKPRKL